MIVGVLGATGVLGRCVVERLLRADVRTRCLVRAQSGAKAALLAAQGADICIGDANDASAVADFCEQADVIVSAVSSTTSQDPGDARACEDRAGNIATIDAAERASVRRFVFATLPDMPRDFPMQSAKRAVERRLATARLEWTVLQCPLLMEVWLSPLCGFDWRAGRVRIFGTGREAVSWISVEDVAGAAFEAAVRGAFGRRLVVLPAADDASLEQATCRLEAISGRPVVREQMPLRSLAAELERTTEPKRKSFLALCLGIGEGFTISGDESVLEPKIGIDDYLKSITNNC